MKSLSRMVSGKVAAPLVMLFALAFAVFAFSLPAETESAPSVGLSETNDTMIVADVLAELPGQDGTAAIVVYRTADGSAMTDAQQEWILGEKKVITPFPGAPEIVTYEGGANEKFTEFSNLEIDGEPFVAPATLSDDKSTASIFVSLDEFTEEAPCTPVKATEEIEACSTVQLTTLRVSEMRALAAESIPAGLNTAMTGPEGKNDVQFRPHI